MAYEITTNGFFSAMYDDLKLDMRLLLNAVEAEEGTYTPKTKEKKELCKVALSKGFIERV